MRSRFRLTYLLVFFLLLAAPAAEKVYAFPPANIELIRFELFPLNNSVRIEWETATELDTVAYKLLRSSNGGFIELTNIGLVSAQGQPALGATYIEIDQTAVNGQTYVYKLIEIESNLTENEVASGVVTVGLQASPTPTLIQIGGITPSSTPLPNQVTQTSTPTPTASPSPPGPTTSAATGTPTKLPTQTPTPSPQDTASATAPPAIATSTPGTAVSLPTATFQSTIDNNDLVVFAQGPETPSSGYPVPATVPVIENNSYPDGIAPTTAPANTAVPTPYPDKADTPPETSLPVIGGQGDTNDSADQNQPASSENSSEKSELGFLWAGFIVALLIFITGILGSIFYFNRKQQP